VNKNRDLLNLLVQSYVSMVSCVLGFSFIGNATCAAGLFHAWRFGNRFFAFHYCKKDE